MKIQVVRRVYTARSTIGDLLIDGKFQCHTLEDTVRQPGIKEYGRTAIGSGVYDLTLTFSPKFSPKYDGKPIPLLNNVPNFEGIRIHWGNTDADTDGCILLGKTEDVDFIGQSREAFNEFYPLLEDGLKEGRVFIAIEDTYATPPTAIAPPVSAPVKGSKK